MTISYDAFLAFVTERHAGQVSKSGEPYIEHLKRVAKGTADILDTLPDGILSADDKAEALLVALGHDVIEDEKATKDDLRRFGATESLVTRVERLSRLEPKPVYQSWIEDIAADDDLVPLIVKLADNQDNNSVERIMALPPEQRSIRKRYDRAYRTLKTALDVRVLAFESRPTP